MSINKYKQNILTKLYFLTCKLNYAKIHKRPKIIYCGIVKKIDMLKNRIWKKEKLLRMLDNEKTYLIRKNKNNFPEMVEYLNLFSKIVILCYLCIFCIDLTKTVIKVNR